MSVTPSPIGGFAAQFFDNNGQPLSGGKIYTYVAGTTTPLATYTSAAAGTPHSNPIILDSAGRVPGGEIWLTDGLVYKFKIDTAADVLIGTYDNIIGVNSNFVNYTVQEEVQTATAGQTVFNLSTINYAPGTNSLSVYIDGVNQYIGDSYLETDSDTVTFTAGLHVGAEVKFTTAISTTGGATSAGAISYIPGTSYPSGSLGNFLDPFFGVADAVFEVTTQAGAGLQRGISVEHYADDVGSYGVDIHQYQGAKSAFVVHCYSDENGAVAGSVAAQIDHTRSGSILTLKNARNAVTSPGTTGTASFLQLIGYPDTSVSLATPPVTLAQWNYQNVLLCPEVSWPFTVTGYGTVINSFSGGTGLTVNHLTPATYGLTVNGKQYGAAINIDSDGGAGLFIAKTSTGLGSGLVIQNEGTGSSLVGISGGSTKYYITKDGDFYVNSAKVLGAQGAAITNGAYAAGATPTKAEFDALVNVVNAILARMRAGTPSIAT